MELLLERKTQTKQLVAMEFSLLVQALYFRFGVLLLLPELSDLEQGDLLTLLLRAHIFVKLSFSNLICLRVTSFNGLLHLFPMWYLL